MQQVEGEEARKWEAEPWKFYSEDRRDDHFAMFTTIFDTRKYSGYEPVHQQLQYTTHFRFVRFTAKYASFEDIALS